MEKNKKIKASEMVSIPEKFKDESGALNTDNLLKSYLALEKKMTERPLSEPSEKAAEPTVEVPQKPAEKMPQPAMAELPKNRPASPDEYQVNLKDSGLIIDAEINRRLFDLGFTNEQVQAVYDIAAEKIVPLIQTMAMDYKADRELAALEREFGGPERFNEVARQIYLWGQKNLSPDIFQSLSCSRDGIVQLYKMMGGSEPEVIREKAADAESVTEESLRKMMQDPRYWKKNDPEFVRKIEQGFKKLYG